MKIFICIQGTPGKYNMRSHPQISHNPPPLPPTMQHCNQRSPLQTNYLYELIVNCVINAI
jgi:hypothetical protein